MPQMAQMQVMHTPSQPMQVQTSQAMQGAGSISAPMAQPVPMAPTPEPVVATPQASSPSPVQFQVQVPAGCEAGSLVQVQAPDGQQVQLTIPAGLHAGDVFTAA